MNWFARKSVPILYVDSSPEAHVRLHRVAADLHAPFKIWSVLAVQAAMQFLQGDSEKELRRQGRLPGMILLDFKSAMLDACQCLRWIRARAHFDWTPVVVCNGVSDPDTVQLCYGSGADAYLCQPANATRFEEIVRGLARCLRAGDPEFEAIEVLREYQPATGTLPTEEDPDPDAGAKASNLLYSEAAESCPGFAGTPGNLNSGGCARFRVWLQHHLF